MTPLVELQPLKHSHTYAGTQDKVLSYLTINVELKPRITNTQAHSQVCK